ncbi:MAG: hypothetical protein PWQ59_1471 [Thermoanaerobacterium sp.]|jgi:hypothetical protein|nr:hypothetical protein [Thermoanaerobacterium sp.]MDK2905058.1 hypothetical protein [Eubacteriaceae bacterium]MDN5300966.1 hypothetical protein [Thermoanaerobacteraceae bacterium]
MELRRMIERDIPDLALLYKQFWNENSSIDLMEKKFAELKNNPNYIFLSAVEVDHLTGSVLGNNLRGIIW